ncbi:MAG: MBL fold metallo-hydrolase [Clostridia bacterium]|nr:MBL fold metallo-hydrolase [Clostridia bacterium]
MGKLIQYSTAACRIDDGVAWRSTGMGYILCSESGELCVIDGGTSDDAEDFLALLEAQTAGKPVVRMWIVTHPHTDHYGALLEICSREDLAARVEVQKIVYHFPFPEEFADKRAAAGWECMKTILANTGAEGYKPAIGEKISVDSLEFHILNTPVDSTICADSNQLSLIFTVQGAERKAMFTGDAGARNLQMVLWRYSSGLECDILQMPHHGLCDTGLREFYEKVNAHTLFIPTSKANMEEMQSNPHYHSLAESNDWAQENASVIYKSYEGTTEIPL